MQKIYCKKQSFNSYSGQNYWKLSVSQKRRNGRIKAENKLIYAAHAARPKVDLTPIVLPPPSLGVIKSFSV